MSTDLLSALNKNGTGLNLRDLAQTIAAAETQPRLSALRNRVEADSVRLSALAQIRGQFDALSGTLAGVAGNPVLTVSTDTPAIMPRVTDRAMLSQSSMPVTVEALAVRQVLEFTGFSGGDMPIEAGSLKIDFGRWDDAGAFDAAAGRPPASIDVPPGTTLNGLAALLNEVPGVTARVLDKGDGTVSLGIVGETGAQNALRIAATAGPGSGGTSLDAFDTSVTNAARQVQAAADARLLVDGIAVTRPGNVIDDLVPGMEITISAPTSGLLAVARDETAARENVQSLIAGLNDTLGMLREMTRRGVGGDEAGELAGDRNVEGLEQALRRVIATPIAGFADTAISLADLGVATQRNGTLRFDPPAFDRAFARNAAQFDALFGDKLQAVSEGFAASGQPGSGLRGGDIAFAIDANGTATLDGYSMLSLDLGDGRQSHVALSGPVQGITVTTEAGVTSGQVRFGRSFVGTLSEMLAQAGAGSGAIGRREAEITRTSEQSAERIDALEARAIAVEKRYLTRFAAMEQAVARMNNTGDYLQNLVEMWSKDR
jgi:flagellar hook-associated protein 2